MKTTLDEVHKLICLSARQFREIIVKLIILDVKTITIITFVFNDHVMKNNTCFHYIC
ncbi:hypothetical protein HanXRQr2_Chr15g0689201 [Helianthus annuus]|uniref:Uncharacterized protein n=1 Tax=Helianthus annuus TaxID=4232 RepID=A0A9K3DZJ2_HELAN|nr:hypothetical protein HanXRQr2_Chr15g0689201 [Helianthus annuus]